MEAARVSIYMTSYRSLTLKARSVEVAVALAFAFLNYPAILVQVDRRNLVLLLRLEFSSRFMSIRKLKGSI